MKRILPLLLLAFATGALAADPVRATGIGYAFSEDGATIDVTFAASGVADGASCTATLFLDDSADPSLAIGSQPFSGPGTLRWRGLAAGAGLSAKVVVEAVSGGATVTQSWTRAVEPGRSVHVVPSLADLSTVFPRVGDIVELPPLAGETDYYVALNIRAFSDGEGGRTLVALEPGFSAVCAMEWDAATSAFVRNATAGLAVCIPEVQGGGRVFFAKPGAKMNWEDASKWTNVTDPSAAADYPRLAGDVAMAALPDNQLVLNGDATVSELYLGPDETHMHTGTQRLTAKNAATLTFARPSGKPGLLRFTGMLRIDTPAISSGFNQFAIGGGDGNSTSTGLGIEMPGGLDLDCGAWPDYTAWGTPEVDSFGRARYLLGENLRYWNIPEGRTLRIFNTYGRYKMTGDDQDGNANFIWGTGGQVTGKGTWFYDGASSTRVQGPFRTFEGVVKVSNKQAYDAFSAGSRGGSFKFRPENESSASASVAENAELLLEGDAASAGLSKSYGVVFSGSSHFYGAWARAINAFPAKRWILDGGFVRLLHDENSDVSWREDGTTATRPICIPNGAETLVVSNGFSVISMSQSGSDGAPTNSLAISSLEHAGDGTLYISTDRIYNSYQNNGAGSSWRVRAVIGGFHDHAIGGTGRAVARHGDASVRTNYLEATAPIVPWIVAPVQYDSSLYFPGADDDTDELVLAGATKKTVLDEATDPTANIRVDGTKIALSADRTVNSLVLVNNRTAGKNLGEGRTLTIASGGLIMGNGNYNNTAYLGDEAGYNAGTAGTVVFPNKAYIFVPVVKDDKNYHPEIWASIVSPHGAVFSYPGDLHLGGDQTGIDGYIAVNGTDLRLGTETTGCQIDVPVHLHGAFARLRIGKQGSFCRQDLYFWDHGTPGCKFEAAAGTTEPVGRLFIDGRPMPRGTYGSSESDAENVDDNHFAGTGRVEVLADDESDPSVGGLELLAVNEGSATVAFDLRPGLGAESVEVRALTSAAGSGEVATNLVYSAAAPADGRFAGTIPGLLPETSYTVRLLATSSSRGVSFEAESPDALDFATGAADFSPLVRLGIPSQAGTGAVSFPWTLVRPGSGRSIVSLRLYWAESAAALADLSSCSFVEISPTNRPGAYATTVAGLPPGASLAAVLVATNDGEADNVCTDGPVAFSTAAEARTGTRPLRAGSCMRTVVGFTAVVLAPAGEPAFQNVYAVWGARHGGEDPSAWDHVLRIGEMGTAAASLSPFLPVEDLADAVYVRFVGYSAEGDPSWTDSYYLPDIPVAAEFAPKVGVGAVAAGGNAATISAYVLDAGSRSENGLVDIVLEYALAPDAFEAGSQAWTRLVPFADGAAVGPVDPVLVSGLRPGRRYYARFVAENDVGQRGAGDVFTFDTVGDESSAPAPEGGLAQQRVSVANDKATAVEAAVWDETKADIVEGAIMAYTGANNSTPPYTSRNGTTYRWGERVGWIYKGYIYLQGGTTTNTFGGYIDDCIVLTIDGTPILRQSEYNSGAQYGSFSPEEAGWFPIEIRMGNGNGGAGAINDGYTFGLGFNTNGTKSVTASAMSRLIDPGDGSFLRPPARTVTLVSTKGAAGDGVDATVALSLGTPAGTLRAYWGDSDGGTNAAAWANAADLAMVDTGATNLVATIPVADPAATPYVRLCVSDGAGTERWTPLHCLDPSQPLIGSVSAAPDGDRMTVSGSLLSVGSGTDFSLRLLWGYAEDLSDAQSILVSSAAGPFSATVPVFPGTNGWWRLVATTSDGGYDATIPAAFTTLAGSVLLGSASASAPTHHTVTVTGSLDVLGAGTTIVSLWYGDDADPSNFVKAAEIPVSAAGSLSIVGTIPGAPRTVYYQLRSINTAPGGTWWTSESRVFTVTTVDQATYTWKIEKTEGEWADPENWDVSGIDDPSDCLGYPDHAKAKVRFVANTTAEIIVTNSFVFADMSLKYANLAVTFVGTNAETCKLTGDVTNVANDQNDGTVVSGTRVVLSGVTLHDSSGAFNWATKVSEDCVLRLENESVLSMDGWMHVFGTNTWVEVVEGSRIAWRNPTSTGAGFDLCNYGGGIRLDDGEMNPPHLVPQRHVGAIGPDQFIEIAGDSLFRCGVYFRTWDNNQDKMLNDVDFVFSVPLKGWKNPGDAPVYADYDRGTADNKKFAYRSPVGEGKIVLSVDQHSPLLLSGHDRTVQLLAWKAGIDTENVRLEQRKGVDMYYTYGWPSTRKTKEGDEIPTGVAARVTGLGNTIMILR